MSLPLGYLDVHNRDRLVFGIHVLHGSCLKMRVDSWSMRLHGGLMPGRQHSREQTAVAVMRRPELSGGM